MILFIYGFAVGLIFLPACHAWMWWQDQQGIDHIDVTTKERQRMMEREEM